MGLRNVPTEEFSHYIPFSCRFINDANAAGLAEVRDLESPRSLVYLSLSNSVGGAVLTKDYAMKIGADYYCRDAKESVDTAKLVLG